MSFPLARFYITALSGGRVVGGLSYSRFKNADTLRATRRPAALSSAVLKQWCSCSGRMQDDGSLPPSQAFKECAGSKLPAGDIPFSRLARSSAPRTRRCLLPPHQPPHPTVKHVSPRVWKFAFSIMKCRKQSVRTLTQHRLTFTDICCWGDV